MTLVSVVIPTLGRPKPLLRALRSVFAQTYRDLEVLVVVDRPDANTDAILRTIDDPRMRVVVNPRPLNAAAARNLGVDHATGAWVAFLDDDDEWLPGKIEQQLAFAAGRGEALISCLSRVVTPVSAYVMPQVIYDNAVPVDEYLFDRRSPFAGVGFIQTSSFLMPRSLLENVRFSITAAHDDWDFVLRLSKELKVRIETVPEVLALLYFEEEGKILQQSYNTWAESLAWIDSMRPLISRRSYAGFCLAVVGARAAKARAYPAIALVLYRAFRYGTPRFWRIWTFIALWVVPRELVRRLRVWWKSAGDSRNTGMLLGGG
jgi:glycosyltransferase involved in cell wall biosynthesis